MLCSSVYIPCTQRDSYGLMYRERPETVGFEEGNKYFATTQLLPRPRRAESPTASFLGHVRDVLELP